jgi:acetolactate synthase-1/2/3 large subunit
LYNRGCRTVFIVTGGFSMYLHDSLHRDGRFNIIVNHHEQGAVYAATGYSKLNKDIPIVCVTSGCGLTNTITGIVDCWQDSVPLLIICGQSNSIETINFNKDNYIGRNFSGQDVDVELITKSITKYSKQINSSDDAIYSLHAAYTKLFEGRPGPSVLCVPLDIQRCENYDQTNIYVSDYIKPGISYNEKIEIENIINKSKRPLIIAGNGIKLSKSIGKFNDFIKKYNIPVVTTFLGTDIICDDNDLYIGKIGIMSKRAGNFASQNADLIISLGSRLPVSVVGYQYKLFTRNCKMLVIDIDTNEHEGKPYKPDYIYKCDLELFFDINFEIKNNYDNWINKCLSWKNMWNDELPEKNVDIMNPYHVINQINTYLDKDEHYNILTNGGNNFYITWQTLKIKKHINFLTSASQGDLGWEIPASIGAYLCNKNNTICIVGDGSFQFNIQELETIKYNKIPILFLVINNKTYSAIEVTQRIYFKRHIGIDSNTGISIPSFKDIAKTYSCEYMLVEKYDEIENIFKNENLFKKPIICEIVVCSQERYPKISSFVDNDNKIVSLPFEDMYPFLSEEQIRSEMINPISELTLNRLTKNNDY